jgi:hypothetical protein
MSNLISSGELFNVESHPISGPYGVISDKKGLFINKECINIVSPKYEVHQPLDIYNRFQSTAEQAGLTVGRYVTNPINGSLLLSAKYDTVKVLNDDVDFNLTFFTSHDGKYRTFLSLDSLRIICMNQLPALYGNKERFIFAEKHYQNALDIRLIEETLIGIPAAIEQFQTTAELLQQKKMNRDLFVEIVAEHYKWKKEQKQYDTKVREALTVYDNAKGQGHLDNSAYKALQAVTYINTHNGNQTPLKAQNAFIKGGDDSLKFADFLMAA